LWHKDCAPPSCPYLWRTVRVCVIRKAPVVLALALAALCYSAPAMADNIHLCEINQFTTCNAGNAIQVSVGTTQALVFGNSNSADALHIAVSTPNVGTGGTFNSGTNLWAVLGVSPTQGFPNFSSTVSKEQLAAARLIAFSCKNQRPLIAHVSLCRENSACGMLLSNGGKIFPFRSLRTGTATPGHDWSIFASRQHIYFQSFKRW
jgi:hypothetical protein